jgi:flagellar M-ring protein FliF
VARVSVRSTQSRSSARKETFDPNSQVVRSEQRNKEKTIGGSIAAGVPGVMSNLPGSSQGVQSAPHPGSVPEAGRGHKLRINKVVSRVASPSSGIKKMSVAVLWTAATSMKADGKGR